MTVKKEGSKYFGQLMYKCIDFNCKGMVFVAQSVPPKKRRFEPVDEPDTVSPPVDQDAFGDQQQCRKLCLELLKDKIQNCDTRLTSLETCYRELLFKIFTEKAPKLNEDTP